ncbi:MAG TPA: hypothetical protein VFG42_15620 [Baekduia sp.]|nr:hypothetical protein [Baekduia sp.]HET6508220.1 hypothetical protein [Baekduia sp.]
MISTRPGVTLNAPHGADRDGDGDRDRQGHGSDAIEMLVFAR